MTDLVVGDGFDITVDSSEFSVEIEEERRLLEQEQMTGAGDEDASKEPNPKKLKKAHTEDVNMNEQLDPILKYEKSLQQKIAEDEEQAEQRRRVAEKVVTELSETVQLPVFEPKPMSPADAEDFRLYMSAQPLILRRHFFQSYSAAKKLVRGSIEIPKEVDTSFHLPMELEEEPVAFAPSSSRNGSVGLENRQPGSTYFARNTTHTSGLTAMKPEPSGQSSYGRPAKKSGSIYDRHSQRPPRELIRYEDD